MVLDVALIAAAALAGWSWWGAGRAGQPFGRRESLLLVGWAAVQVLARVVDLVPSPAAAIGSDVLLAVSNGLALTAAVLIVRRITALVGGLGAALAESALVAASATTLVWVLGGAAVEPSPAAFVGAVPAVILAATLALVLRLSFVVPETVRVADNRTIFLVCATGVGLVGAGDVLAAAATLGAGIPVPVQQLAALLGYLGVYAIARVKTPPTSPAQPVPRVRALPYVLASTAVVTVYVQAILGPTGWMPVLLVALVVASLVALQAFTLQENAALVARLTSSRTRLTALVENTSDLIVRLDGNGRMQAANAAAVRLLHRTPESLTGRSFDDLARAEDRRAVREAVLDVTRGRRDAASVELRLAPPAAGTAQLRLRAVPGGAVANLNDVTDSVELRQRLERLARYDQMTGLVNRGHLLEVVGDWLAAPGAQVVVLYADLDGFKAVNDRFGHRAGDRVLVEVASRFDAIAGALDGRRAIVGRFGGDEFVMALEGLEPEQARLAAERVVEAISPPFQVGDRTVTLGVSVGVAAACPDDGTARPAGPPADAAGELVHRADLAMYEAKAGGRARVGSWTPELEGRARRRVDIAIGLRDALEVGRLAVAYQPIVRLADGVVVGAEALLRLPPGVGLAELSGLGGIGPGGDDDLVSPAELVSVAEDIGIITEMGEWVLTQAVQEAAAWAEWGSTASVSVNMSVHQLVSPQFVESVASILRACGLPPSHLILELTESQLAGHAGPAVEALERLRESGVRVAIDDFGTGYSSLSYLRRMPVQLVKLDRALLDGVGVDPRATALARSVVGMTRDLGLLVVAEGMEDGAALRAVRDLGAYAGQGFALAPALPAAAMREVLRGPALDLDAEPDPEPEPEPERVLDLVALEADDGQPALIFAEDETDEVLEGRVLEAGRDGENGSGARALAAADRSADPSSH